MNYGHKIETMFLIIDSEFNQSHFASVIGCHLEAPIGANHREIPASDVLSDTDFIDLEFIDKRADKHGFDMVRIVLAPCGTVNYLLSHGGIVQNVASHAQTIGFLDGLDYRMRTDSYLGTVIGRLPFVTRTMTVESIPAEQTAIDTLTAQSDDDNPYNNDNKGMGSGMPRKPAPKQPSGPSNAVKAPRQMAARF